MPEAGLERWSPLFTGALVVLVPALLWILLRNHRAREAVGEPLAVERSKRVRVLRAAAPAVALVALFVWCTLGDEPDARFEAFHAAFEALALAVLVAWLAPSKGDRAIGRGGVQFGGRARRWTELMEPAVEDSALVSGPPEARERVELSPALLLAARTVLDAP
ncbi:MAG: hypothetical protein HZA53_06940 [Planctomycetes bacterium]|nr:hypothetical protein [Planctomycetota bacterium]